MRRFLCQWIAIGAAIGAIVCIGARSETQPNNFRFSILGDRTGETQPGVYEQVWQELNSFHPDFVINAGDTIQGGNDATAEAEWRALRPLWNRYKYPIYFTPGNHDIWSAESRRIYEKETHRPAFYGFDYQNAHFTVLDNSETENLGDQQMAFLEHDLAAHKDRDPKFVFFHKPFWLIPVKFGSTAFPFHQLVKKYGVRYVVSGHTHQFARDNLDGVTYLNAGSAGGHLRSPRAEDGWFFGLTVVKVNGASVEITVAHASGLRGQAGGLSYFSDTTLESTWNLR